MSEPTTRQRLTDAVLGAAGYASPRMLGDETGEGHEIEAVVGDIVDAVLPLVASTAEAQATSGAPDAEGVYRLEVQRLDPPPSKAGWQPVARLRDHEAPRGELQPDYRVLVLGPDD